MKNFKLFSTVMLVLALAFTSYAQGNNDVDGNTDGPIMTFENLVVDYGEIEQHAEPLRKAKFTNTGTAPLVIKNARGSCGCTVPTYPQEPIMPGQSAEIEIRYDTKRVGRINKTVTITTNAPGDAIVLKVVGNITKAASEESVPKPKSGLIKTGNN